MAEKKEKQYVSDNAQLMAAWDLEKNTELTPDSVTLGSGKKVWWKCKEGHSWMATVDKRSSGKGCPYCSGRLVSDNNRLTIIKPEIAITWDYEKNYPLTPDEISFSSNKKVWWKCKTGHSWIASCNSRSNGNDCPYCSGRLASDENNLVSKNQAIITEWDFIKNKGISPNQFTPFSLQEVWWKCPTGHSYKKSIAKKSRGDGCPICSNRLVVSGINDLATTHPDLVNEWDNEKNHPITPWTIHAGSTKKVWWKCKNGHSWEASIVNRSRGRNCPYCSGKLASGEWNLASHSPMLIEEWDYEKNKNINPEQVTPYSNNKVWWRCEFGHSWEASINKRVNGSRCPSCWSEMRTSFPEQCVLYYLKKLFKNVSNSYQFLYNAESFEFDVFIHDINAAIEYDGEHFHKNKLEADRKKNIIAKQAGVNLYRIREKGCPPIDGCTVILLEPNYINNNFESLERAISDLIKKIAKNDIKICIEEDQHEIYQQYISFKRDRSFAVVCPTLATEWDYEKNGNLSPLNVSFGSAKTVWWKCQDCGYEYKMPIVRRKQGRGCPACAGKIVVEGMNDLSTIYPLISENWDYVKNSPLLPTQVMPKSHKTVWWTCKKCGYEWQQKIANRTRAAQCPKCGN